jgi:hypothetical protein
MINLSLLRFKNFALRLPSAYNVLTKEPHFDPTSKNWLPPTRGRFLLTDQFFSSPPPRFTAPDCNSDHQEIDETTKSRMTISLSVETR